MLTKAANTTLWVKVTVPIASFAIPYAREFVESFPFPPPTTVYGMLLSLIGETNRYQYEGSRIRVLVIGTPELSLVLRKIRRFKDKEIGSDKNSKPDFQTLLTGLKFFVGIQDSEDEKIPSLSQSVRKALQYPDSSTRFGGLSCGESHNLIDRITFVDSPISDELLWELRPQEDGEWTIPLWVDHVGSSGTKWTTATFHRLEGETQSDSFFIVSSK
ncbi:MAG: type I-MYXAN CRISPR-associated protein Cas5/Cmx5/DevS [Desulfitobacteriaceae bacterium]